MIKGLTIAVLGSLVATAGLVGPAPRGTQRVAGAPAGAGAPYGQPDAVLLTPQLAPAPIAIGREVCTPTIRVYWDTFDGAPVFAGGATGTLTGGANEGVQSYALVDAGQRHFAGQFRRSTAGVNVPIRLTLENLAAHTHIDLDLLLAVIDSWDGNTGPAPDYFNITVDGVLVFQETFDTFDLNDQTYDPPAGAILSWGGNLGFSSWTDGAYDLGFDPGLHDIPHTAASVTIDFFASGSGWQAGSDESWALENVAVFLCGTASADCNGNGLDDALDISGGLATDCDADGVPDECELAAAGAPDCNLNDTLDSCDIAGGTSQDLDSDGLPDECESGFVMGDVVDREITFRNEAPVVFEYGDALGREITFRNEPASVAGFVDAVSRELTFRNEPSVLFDFTDAVARELTFRNEPGIVYEATDAVGRELSFRNETVALSQINDAIGRELTYFLPIADLAVSIVDAPTSAYVGEPASVAWEVTNDGGHAAVAPWADKVYLSTDDQLSSGDVLLGGTTQTDDLPAGQTSAPQGLSFTWPGTPGTFYLLFVTDADNAVPEEDAPPGNNIAAQAVELLQIPLPDLAVQALQTPTQATAGDVITVEYTVENVGTATALEPWQDAIYLSSDEALDPHHDRLLRLDPIGAAPLAIGGTYSRSRSVTLPISFTALTGYILVKTDYADVIDDADPNNNVKASAAIAIAITPAPDLVASDVVTVNSATFGDTINVAWMGANIGLEAATGIWSDAVLLSTDDQLSPDDRFLGAQSIDVAPFTPSAPPYVASLDVDLPLDIESIPGSYYILVVADGNGAIAELDEDNNAAAYGPILLDLPPLPNLIVGSVLVPGSVTVGQSATVSWDVSNVGGVPVQASFLVSVGVRAAGDPNVTPLKNVVFDAVPLGAGATVPQSTSVVVPELGDTEVEFVICVDSDSDVLETNEDDNCATAPAVPYERPDLSLAPFSAPANAVAGQNAVVTFQVDNLGGAAARPIWIDAVYISSDAAVGNDILVGSSIRSAPLPAGDHYIAQVSVRLPENLLGNYYFVAVTDADDRVIETGDPANNARVASAATTVTQPPRPNLIVTNVAPLDPGLSGQQRMLSFSVQNIGTAAAGPLWVDRVYVSTDAVVSANDGVLGDFSNVSSLAPNASYTQNVQITYPSQPGTYYILVTTDYTKTVNEGVEGGENDNTTPSPTFVVTTFAVPALTATVKRDAQMTTVTLEGNAVIVGTNTPAPGVPVVVRLKLDTFERKVTGITDPAGAFSVVYEPGPTEGGRYAAAAGPAHVPTASLPVLATFDLYTLITLPDELAFFAYPDVAAHGSFQLKNPTTLPQTGITWNVNGLPAGALTLVIQTGANLLPGQATAVSYTLNVPAGTHITNPVEVNFTSSQGAGTTLPITLTLAPVEPVLTIAPGELDANGKLGGTLIRGQRSYAQVRMKNVGGLATDPLAVTLPTVVPWLSTAVVTPLAPVAPGGETALVLQLDPPADAAFGTYVLPVQVQFAPGKTLILPFEFVMTSTGIGTLKITATDEFTYYDAANNYPKVAGATVKLIDPITNALFAQGTTDLDGVVLFEGLTEAYYNIEATAPGHGVFRSSILVRGGQTTEVEAFMPASVVSYNWTVVPTNVVDEYKITIEATFQTNVPAPVVVLEPTHIDLATLELPAQIDFTVTNYGLITAQNVRFSAAGFPGLDVIPLVTDLGDLPGGCTAADPFGPCRVTIPTLFIPTEDTPRAGCNSGFVEACWDLVCGDKTYTYCGRSPFGTGCPITPGGGGGGGGGGAIGGAYFPPSGVGISLPCDFCFDENKAINCAKSIAGCGPIPCPGNAFDCGNGPWGTDPLGAAGECLKQGVACAADTAVGAICPPCQVAGCICGLLRDCLPHCIDTDCVPCGLGDLFINAFKDNCRGGGEAGPREPAPFDDPLFNTAYDWYLAMRRYIAAMYYPLGDEKWAEGTEPGIFLAWLNVFELAQDAGSDDGIRISAAERAILLTTPYPSHLTPPDVEKFLDRWNRTQDYYGQGIFTIDDVPDGWSTDFIDRDFMQALGDAVMADNALAQSLGFTGTLDAMNYYEAAMIADATDSGDGICAKVKIQIDQTATLTRSAFKATLELENSGIDPLEGIGVNIVLKDIDGNVATDRFGIYPPELTGGLTGVAGNGSLPPASDGTASWIIIPTDDAAPLVPATYFVSGSLQYSINGRIATIPLYPVQIDVLPNPRLELSYFLEKIVYSDDPFTPELEPAIPFSLGLLVQNVGAGVAQNMQITSAQPKIIENTKGLVIDFDIIGTQVGNDASAPSLTVVLGDIAAYSAKVARWLLVCTLQGEFISYAASFEHVDSLGDPRLSLIDSVDIFGLVHVVRADEISNGTPPDEFYDFLTDDFADLQDMPDRIHHSDGRVETVLAVQNAAATTNPPALEATVTATMPTNAWAYIRIDDPYHATYRLKRVTRGDGKVLQLDWNAWQTDRINRSVSGSPVERYVHIFDRGGPGTYTLEFDPDSQAPTVAAWHTVVDYTDQTIGEAGILIMPGQVGVEPRTPGIRKLVVTFSESVDPTTFTATNVLVDGVDAAGNTVVVPPLATSLRQADRVGVVEFTAPLPDEARYCVTLAGVKDRAGNLVQGAGARLDISALVGDLTGDRRVNNTDVGGLATLLGTDPIDKTEPLHVRCDVNADGKIDPADLTLVLARRGKTLIGTQNPCLFGAVQMSGGVAGEAAPVIADPPQAAPSPAAEKRRRQ